MPVEVAGAADLGEVVVDTDADRVMGADQVREVVTRSAAKLDDGTPGEGAEDGGAGADAGLAGPFQPGTDAQVASRAVASFRCLLIVSVHAVTSSPVQPRSI